MFVQYFAKVAERIKDTGVSVRKRAIKIIRDMCTSNSSFTEFPTACIEIIARVNDEESSIQVEGNLATTGYLMMASDVSFPLCLNSIVYSLTIMLLLVLE